MARKNSRIAALALILCLICIQLVAVQTTNAGPDAPASGPSIQGSSDTYEQVFDLAFRLAKNKALYGTMNQLFASALISAPIPAVAPPGLTATQIIYLLMATEKQWDTIEALTEKIPSEPSEDPLTQKRLEEFRKIFADQANNEATAKSLITQNHPLSALTFENQNGGASYEKADLYLSHPWLSNPDDIANSKLMPADDLRQKMLDFVNGAQHEIWINVFDFDLKVLAEALVAANKRGVKVNIGIDRGNYDLKSEVKDVVRILRAQKSETMKVNLIDGHPFNHQKLAARDVGHKTAAALFSTANFTQSCAGPEGDAVDVPPADRPKESIPNANDLLIVKGSIPAAIAKHEMRKILEYGLNARADFPLGGGYQIKGPTDPATGKPSTIFLAFAPNGGQGSLIESVYIPVVRSSQGAVEGALFAFSSTKLLDALTQKFARDIEDLKAQGKSPHNLFRAVGDTPFAMQYWSNFLALSGLEVNEKTGKYETRKDFPIKALLDNKQWKAWQENLRIAPGIYGDREIPNKDGKSLHIVSKLHHKMLLFPKEFLGIIGGSFNPSENADTGNIEQVVLVRDSRLIKKARGGFAYLYEGSRRSVQVEAARRNRLPRRPPTPTEPTETEKEFLKRPERVGAGDIIEQFEAMRISIEPLVERHRFNQGAAVRCSEGSAGSL